MSGSTTSNATKTEWYAEFYSGPFDLQRVLQAVRWDEWQEVRVSMLGIPLETKRGTLRKFIADHPRDVRVNVVVTNYVTALARGGLIR